MGRPPGSRSALGAQASRRNFEKARDRKARRHVLAADKMAQRREEARLAKEEAQAIREQAKARLESGELGYRSEFIVEVQRMQRLVRAELDRAAAYLDPGLPPEVRTVCEAAIATAVRKLRHALADKVEGKHGD